MQDPLPSNQPAEVTTAKEAAMLQKKHQEDDIPRDRTDRYQLGIVQRVRKEECSRLISCMFAVSIRVGAGL